MRIERVGEGGDRQLQVGRDRLGERSPSVASRSATDSRVTSTSTGEQARR